MLRQVKADNKMWGPVDGEDARHMQREAAKRQKEAEKAEKAKEKMLISHDEESKQTNNNGNEGKMQQGWKRNIPKK